VTAARRDRALLVVGLAAVSALAWGHLASMSARLPAGAPHHHAALPGPRPWSGADLATAAAMWAVMMLAMMVPVVAPWVLAIARAAPERGPGRALPSAGAFLAGYGAVWLGFSIAAAAGQLLLQRAALLSGGALTSPVVAAALLAAAGAWQWTPLRDACLRHCRSPMGFFLLRWRDGAWGAFGMGARHGTFCLGCCWALMALAFVFGVMSLLWMAALTAYLLVEKSIAAGPWLPRLAGAGLVGAALWVVAGRWSG
jgi:predicted metal-binding membrane protein